MADDIPIETVDAMQQIIRDVKKMIERIESGKAMPTDPELGSLKQGVQDMEERLKKLGN